MPEYAPFQLFQRPDVRQAPKFTWAAFVAATPPEAEACVQALLQDAPDAIGLRLTRLRLASASATKLADRLQGGSSGFVLTGMDAWKQAQWRALDLNRGLLEERGPVILVLSPAGAGSMANFAPNIARFIGATNFNARDDVRELTEPERASRIADLRNGYGFSDAELVRKREHEQLPLDADLAEWLALLGRGDLL